MTRNSIVEMITPWWEIVLYLIIALFAVLTAASVAMLVLTIIFKRRNKTGNNVSEEVKK